MRCGREVELQFDGKLLYGSLEVARLIKVTTVLGLSSQGNPSLNPDVLEDLVRSQLR